MLLEKQHLPAHTNAHRLSQRAFEKMAELSIQPTPNNYTIWYHYFAGTYEKLNRTIDILIGNGQRFTAQRNTEIFKQFFTNDKNLENLHTANHQAEEHLGDLRDILKQSSDELIAFDESLMRAQDQLDDQTSENTVGEVSQKIRYNITSALAHHATVAEMLQTQSASITHLQDQLGLMRENGLCDRLTGLPNRDCFFLELQKAMLNATAYGQELSLLMIDVREFKRSNEFFGHEIFMQILSMIADVVRQAVKGQDIASRYGDDTIAVILPNTTMKNALHLAEDIDRRITAQPVIHKDTGERLGRVNAAMGAALFEYGEPLHNLVQRAEDNVLDFKARERQMILRENVISIDAAQ